MGDNRLPAPSRGKIMLLVVVAVTVSGLVDQALGHVSLTFPPARKYDLDFLDNSRTKGPCGMPKGESNCSLTRDGMGSSLATIRAPMKYELSRNWWRQTWRNILLIRDP